MSKSTVIACSTDTEVDKLAKFVEEWRSNAALFVCDQFGIKPTAQQIEALNSSSKRGARVAVKSGHGTGKSTVLAWLILWALCCFKDVKIALTAPSFQQLRDIVLPEVEKWRQKMLEPWRSSISVKNNRVDIKTLSGFASARAGNKSNPEALQGFHAEELLMFLIDEASGVFEGVFEVAKGAMSTESASIVMMSNPTRTTGYFHKAFHRNRNQWDCITFSCINSSLVSKTYVESMRDEYGDDSDIYRVRVLGEFPKGGDLQFIPTALVDEARKKNYEPKVYNFAPILLGVDVAWFGGDISVIVKRQGLFSEILFKDQCEIAFLANKTAEYEDKYKAHAVFVDATGIGAGVVSNLRQMNRNPIAIMFGGASTKQQYKNKRAECWGLMKQWLEDGGSIPDDERMADELCAPDYCYDSAGKIQIERKEDMRARGLASPDHADALSLTFGAPVIINDRKTISYDEMPVAGAL